ncbi:MAG TPA: efflux RND transporter periplasmic adaptor subunit [Mucilaginibacter sp.]
MKHYPLYLMLILLVIAGCKNQNEIKPQRKDIVDAVFGSGHVENRDQYAVTANTDGYLKAAYVAEGDTIKEGQKLFRLTNDVQQTQVVNALTNLQYAKSNIQPRAPQIEQLKTQITQAQDKLAVDSLNYARYKRLVKTQAVSNSDFENVQLQYQSSVSSLKVLQHNLADLQRQLNLSVENAKAQYNIQQENNNYYNITGRANGLVLSVAKKTGDYVKKGDVIAQVGAGKPVIKLYIAEDDIQRVRVGQLTLISLNSSKDQVLKAYISKIYPSFDTNEQAFIVEATLKDQANDLKNGTQLQCNIIIQEKKNVLVVPTYSLINGDYIMLKDHKEKIPVKTGIRTLEWTEVLSGITENDVLVIPKQNN